MWQRALARVSNRLPLFASCIVLEAFSLPTRGFGHWAQHLGARLGSLDRRRRTLPGQRGRIDNNAGAQGNTGGLKTQHCVVSCPCVCLQLSVFVCVSALSLVSFSSGALFSSLSSDLFSFSPSFLICPQLLLFSGVSVNRQTVVGAIDESRPGLHSGGL